MKTPTTRRAAITALGAGVASVASLSLLSPQVAMAAISSSAGIVAGGSLEGPDGPIQFSAFGSRTQLDDVDDPVLQGALSWYDATGMEGELLVLALVSVTSYGPGSEANVRVLTGTLSANGEGKYPFGLLLVDGGEIGEGQDTVRLVVGEKVSEITATPIPAGEFSYDVFGALSAGNVQIVEFA